MTRPPGFLIIIIIILFIYFLETKVEMLYK